MAKGKYQEWLTPDGILRLEAWARDGLTDEQLAKKMNITPSTLYDWKKKYSEISEALKKGKEVVDIEVENALLKRAKGFEYCEEKIEMETNGAGQVLSRKVVQVVKQVAPDVGAAVFWLKNRKPDAWRDKKDIAVEGDIGMNLSNEQLDTEIEKLNGLLGIDESG
ncbi:transposase [Scatolibacter rhodanostii]|uniref:transposase n=1 Tax=Scatolibacter rhodanostii TaxID=2014781 RepID=UPI000C078AC7|nr:transposase [Scatolibacter rhodanostii]